MRTTLIAILIAALLAAALLLLVPRARPWRSNGAPREASPRASRPGAEGAVRGQGSGSEPVLPSASARDAAPREGIWWGGGLESGGVKSGRSASTRFVRRIPFERAAKLARPMAAAASWPPLDALSPLAGQAGGASAADRSLVDQLRSLVERFLSPALRPPDGPDALLADRGGRVYERLGSPGGPCSGLASRDLVADPPCLAFELEFRTPVDSCGPETLAARLRDALAPAVLDELAHPACAPRPHPAVAAPDGFAATALLDRGGVGAIFPYLYLYETPEGLVGVFQQVPHGRR